MKIETIKISEIKPYKNNPRRNDKAVEIVKRSIKEFGFKNPMLLDQNNEIIAGHTRLKAAIELDYKEVPYIKIEDLTPEQVKAFRIMDNKSSENAQWDNDLLKEEFTELDEAEYDLELTGFELREVGDILDEGVEVNEDIVAVDAYERAKSKTKIKQGEIYQLGDHRLMCGDSTEKSNVDKLMGENKADMVFTDPPYNINYQDMKGKHKSIENDNLENIEFNALLAGSFEFFPKIGYVCCNWKSLPSISEALKDAEIKVKSCIVWDKNYVQFSFKIPQ